MKIKILKSCSGYNFSFKQGDVVNVNNYIGKDLIGCGFADEVKATTKKKAKTESEPETENADA